MNVLETSDLRATNEMHEKNAEFTKIRFHAFTTIRNA